MTNFPRLPIAALAAALSLAIVAAPAMAQRTTDKAAPKATTAKDAAKKSAKKTTPSPCKGLAEAQCKANTACTYVGASVRKATGKKIAAYCRLKGGKKK